MISLSRISAWLKDETRTQVFLCSEYECRSRLEVESVAIQVSSISLVIADKDKLCSSSNLYWIYLVFEEPIREHGRIFTLMIWSSCPSYGLKLPLVHAAILVHLLAKMPRPSHNLIMQSASKVCLFSLLVTETLAKALTTNHSSRLCALDQVYRPRI